jgi:hypothetical protein
LTKLTVKGQTHAAPWFAAERSDSATLQFRIVGAESTGFTTSTGTVSPVWTNVIDNGNSSIMLSTLFAGGTGGKIILDGNVGINQINPETRLHVTQSAPGGIGGLPSNTTAILDSASDNYLTFRNSADNGSQAGLVFQDNNVGGFIVFKNATGTVATGSDSMMYGAYQDHIFLNGSSEVIGYGGKSETMRITSAGNVNIAGTLTEASTRRIKENIRPITGALDKVTALSGVLYDKIDGTANDEPGLIAEDVYDVIKELVVLDEEGKPAGIKYTKTVAYLVEAVKELSDQIKELKSEMNK